MAPASATLLLLASLAGQALGLFPGVFESGALIYTAYRCWCFCRPWTAVAKTLAWPFHGIALVALTTAVWFLDSTWINYLFGSQVSEGSVARTALQIFLVFAAVLVLTLTAWTAAYAVRNASASARAQAEAESRLERTATALEVEQDRNRIPASCTTCWHIPWR